MRHQDLKRAACGMAVLVAPLAFGLTEALAGDRDHGRLQYATRPLQWIAQRPHTLGRHRKGRSL